MTRRVRVSVVIPSHGRPLRLMWLLNALEHQTLRDLWEVVVVHDYDAATAARYIDGHPLARRGRLRQLVLGGGTTARRRNAGWRAATGGLVAFTDDDCRPEPRWLEHLVANHRLPDDVVRGATRPDPLEIHVLAAPHVSALHAEQAGPLTHACNVLYPRPVLERLGGFDERAATGDAVELAQRARAGGSQLVDARRAVVNQAVESRTVVGAVRESLAWWQLPYVVARQPALRDDLTLHAFRNRDHLWMTVALAGLAGGRRRRALRLLALPWLLSASRRRGLGPRNRATALAELPGQSVRQLAAVAGMATGSVRHRTLVL